MNQSIVLLQRELEDAVSREVSANKHHETVRKEWERVGRVLDGARNNTYKRRKEREALQTAIKTLQEAAQ